MERPYKPVFIQPNSVRHPYNLRERAAWGHRPALGYFASSGNSAGLGRSLFLDLGGYLVDNLFKLVFGSRFAQTILFKKVFDLLAKFLTLFWGEKQSCTRADDSATYKS